MATMRFHHIAPNRFATALLLLFSMTVSAQTADSLSQRPALQQVQLEIAPNYVFQTRDFLKGDNLKNRKIDQSLSFHLKYAFQFARDSYFGRLYPHAYQGIGVSYNTFFNSTEVGNPIAVYVFQGSRIAGISRQLSLDYEWNFGASFEWKPYDSNKNVFNNVVGSKVNAYLNFGLYLNWRMNGNWNLRAGIDATHYSNGNTHYPNAGVNLIGARIGIARTFDATYLHSAKYHPTDIVAAEKPYWCFDVAAYGATRSKGIVSENYIVPGSFGVCGLTINPMYSLNKYVKTGLSLDGQYDESANLDQHIAGHNEDDGSKLMFYRQPFSERFSVGMSLRTEFTMPIFSINFGIGHNVIYKGDDHNGFYQVLILKTFITRNIFLHTGYRLNKFHDPENLMMGIGYRFTSRHKK
jgi:hypothetical protein